MLHKRNCVCGNVLVVPREALGAVIRNLAGAEHREQVVRKLAPWPEAVRAEMLGKWWWSDLEDAAEVARLKAIIAGDE